MVNLIVDFFITITLHEFIHYLFAKKFKRNPELKFENFICPYIEYDNSYKYIENCIISMSPLVIHIVLFFLGKEFLKVINLGFLFMILPITSDGFTFWRNLIKYISNRYSS